MRVVSVLLADQAHVRNGLISILGGGINRIWRDEYPGPMGAVLAVTLELRGQDFGRDFELSIRIRRAGGAEVAAAGVSGLVQRDLDEPDIRGLPGYASLAIDLHPTSIPKPGRYVIQLRLNGRLARSVSFYAGYRKDAPDPRIRAAAAAAQT